MTGDIHGDPGGIPFSFGKVRESGNVLGLKQWGDLIFPYFQSVAGAGGWIDHNVIHGDPSTFIMIY